MRNALPALALSALFLVSSPAASTALDASSLWPKVLSILEKVEKLEEQNREILQNQQRILEEMEGLRAAIESVDEPPGKGEGVTE